jgi:hypothetical protein
MRRMLALIAVSVLLLAACGADEGGGQASGGRTEDEGEGGRSSDRAKAATVEVSSSNLGQLLVDAEGMTLYMFVPDQQENGEPTCYDECTQAWPALEATGEVAAGDGLEQSLSPEGKSIRKTADDGSG